MGTNSETTQMVFEEFKAVVLKSFKHEDPGITDEQLAQKKVEIEEKLTMDAPLTALGWDSMTMTWLVVTLEDKLNIDISSLSLMELYSIGDLINELTELVEQKES